LWKKLGRPSSAPLAAAPLPPADTNSRGSVALLGMSVIDWTCPEGTISGCLCTVPLALLKWDGQDVLPRGVSGMAVLLGAG
jgi:hypothetical protein